MNNIECRSMRYDGDFLYILDQRKLPDLEDWVKITELEDMYEAIFELKVRGAPAIGVSAVLYIADQLKKGIDQETFKKYCERLKESRPTAVNLVRCLDRLLNVEAFDPQKIISLAESIYHEDIKLCDSMGEHGASLIEDGDHILTHCNTGGLATAGIGTALGVIQKAFEQGKKIHVYVDETRPLLQGGRLTAWELCQLGIPHTVICDNMAASLMREGKINKIFVGSDRIARNGDFANKIGTYSVAVNAKHHNVPFYCVAPYTTLDLKCESGSDIPIELRREAEVKGVSGFFGDIRWSPKESPAYNPAFDVTPANLVSAWVLDCGIYNIGNLNEWESIDQRS